MDCNTRNVAELVDDLQDWAMQQPFRKPQREQHGLLGNLRVDADIAVHNLSDLKVYTQAHDIDSLHHK